MEEKVFAIVIVQHAASLRLYCDPSFPLDVQLIENLLVAARRNRLCELEEPVAKCAFAMVYMRYDTEVSKPLDRYCGDSFLGVRKRFGSLRCGTPRRARKGPYDILASKWDLRQVSYPRRLRGQYEASPPRIPRPHGADSSQHLLRVLDTVTKLRKVEFRLSTEVGDFPDRPPGRLSAGSLPRDGCLNIGSTDCRHSCISFQSMC